MEDDASPANQSKNNNLARQHVLWVDGAGVYLVCLGNEVTIGGARNDPNHADVCLMSNLSRKHLTLIRSNGTYHLQTHASVTLTNCPFPTDSEEQIALEDSTEWKMGEGVMIQFRLPTVLSSTAVLDFQSSHRPLVGHPPSAVDQVILMDQNLLMGSGSGQHVRLKDCQEGVILFRSKHQLWCKSKTPFSKNDQPSENTGSLQSGDIVTGRDFRFRLEAVTAATR